MSLSSWGDGDISIIAGGQDVSIIAGGQDVSIIVGGRGRLHNHSRSRLEEQPLLISAVLNTKGW